MTVTHLAVTGTPSVLGPGGHRGCSPVLSCKSWVRLWYRLKLLCAWMKGHGYLTISNRMDADAPAPGSTPSSKATTRSCPGRVQQEAGPGKKSAPGGSAQVAALSEASDGTAGAPR